MKRRPPPARVFPFGVRMYAADRASAYHLLMDVKRVGGCLCGAVRYEVRGEIANETLCHCTSCRRASAAPVVAWFSVSPEAFRLTKGLLKSFASSPGVVRSFCGECGTPLTYLRDGVRDLDVTICSLDDPESAPPRDHIYVRSTLTWAAVEDGLPRFPGLRDASDGSQ